MTPARSPLRLLRGGTAASLATAVALGGHLAAGAAMPTWLGVALPWWLAVTLCTVLAGTRFSLLRMGVAVLSSQALFHGLFSAGTPGNPSLRMVDPPGSHLGHSHPSAGPLAEHSAHTAHGGASGAEAAAHVHHSDLHMLLWHLVAALVTTVLLHRGESLLLRCAGLVGAVLLVLSRPPRSVTLPLLIPSAPVLPVPETAHLHHAQRAVLTPQLRRGPPLVLAA